jgi:hypothetical protein
LFRRLRPGSLTQATPSDLLAAAAALAGIVGASVEDCAGGSIAVAIWLRWVSTTAIGPGRMTLVGEIIAPRLRIPRPGRRRWAELAAWIRSGPQVGSVSSVEEPIQDDSGTGDKGVEDVLCVAPSHRTDDTLDGGSDRPAGADHRTDSVKSGLANDDRVGEKGDQVQPTPPWRDPAQLTPAQAYCAICTCDVRAGPIFGPSVGHARAPRNML